MDARKMVNEFTHPAVALVHKVVRVAERHISVLGTVPRDVADVVIRARVRVSVGAAEVELESVALVGDEVGVAIRGLALSELDGSKRQVDIH